MIRWFLPGLLAVGVVFLVFWYGATVKAGECAGTIGKASYYCCEHNGRPTASGAIFNEREMTAASNVLPMGSVASVRNVQNGRIVQIRVTDRGGFAKYGRIIDLSAGAFAKLAPLSKGIIRVCVTRLR